VDTDEAWVRRYLGGDHSAFRSLVERNTPPIYNLAYRMTGDRDEASDVTQETFRRVVEALPSSRIDLPFKPWAMQIALNLRHDLARRRRPLPFAALDGAEDDETADRVEMVVDTEPLPPDRLETDETRRALQQAVDDLPEVYRAAIVLRYSEDMSYQDIADTLNLPLNTVRTHLARAKRLLQARLQAEWGNEA
jgi:RNA polymerase sigma-70 factor (ECF subfamily)